MKRIKLFTLTILIWTTFISVSLAQIEQEPKVPCVLMLNQKENIGENALGVALVYIKREKMPGYVRERNGVSIHAHHLPSLPSLGEYDGYQGFAQIPGQISWQFPLYPTSEPEGPTWAGRFDEISGMLPTLIQVRLYNSKTQKLGPAVLENQMVECFSSE